MATTVGMRATVNTRYLLDYWSIGSRGDEVTQTVRTAHSRDTQKSPGRDRATIQMLMRFAYARGKAMDEAAESISRRLPMVAYGLDFNGPARIRQEERVDAQRALRACFNQLLSVGPFTWAPPVNRLEITYLGIQRTERGAVERHCALAYPGALWFAVVEVLQRSGSFVRRCAHCPKPYIRSGRMDYCSQACSQKARSAKWYAAHREEAIERKHESYKRNITLRQRGANVVRRKRKR